MELEELYEYENINVLHYLMIDAHYTWWDCVLICAELLTCCIWDILMKFYSDMKWLRDYRYRTGKVCARSSKL